MGRSELFDHTADVGLRAFGDDPADLFRSAATGLFGLIVANPEAVEPAEAEPIELAAPSIADLLFAWLDELIFRSETRHRLYNRFDVAVADDGQSLRGSIRGEPIDRGRHRLDHEVKAVTRHAFRVEPHGDGWVAEVILDI